MKHVAIVGAGFSGATIARSLADNGYVADVFDARSHVAGNCYTARDEDTGVNVHVYGPHIFHTSNENIWKFVNQFGELMPFVNRVKANAGGRIFSLPINLLTINQFFGRTFSPTEAQHYIESIGDKRFENPQTFEEQALRFLGRALYETFFEGYTIKQWGVHPSELPASILKRLPIRFNYDDNYYASRFQGIPKDGYTQIVEHMLDHPNIRLHLNSKFARADASGYEHVFFSGTIDSWFNYVEGRLKYRTLKFVSERHRGDYQGNPVMNYCDRDIPWTRISEHKHFAPWECHEYSLVSKEYSYLCTDDDIPYYPLRLANDKETLSTYVTLANYERKTTFVGRLGTYRYLDMHVAISEALEIARIFLLAQRTGDSAPVFSASPLG